MFPSLPMLNGDLQNRRKVETVDRCPEGLGVAGCQGKTNGPIHVSGRSTCFA